MNYQEWRRQLGTLREGVEILKKTGPIIMQLPSGGQQLVTAEYMTKMLDEMEAICRGGEIAKRRAENKSAKHK